MSTVKQKLNRNAHLRSGAKIQVSNQREDILILETARFTSGRHVIEVRDIWKQLSKSQKLLVHVQINESLKGNETRLKRI